VQDTKLVRTSVDGDPHKLVLRRSTDESSAFGPLFDLLPDDGPTDLLAVTHEQSQQFLHAWRDRIDRRPRNVGVVSVGEQMRSTASASVPQRTNRPVLRGVPDPTDVEEMRETATQFLDAWSAGGRTVAYVDSVTALVDELGVERAVEFVETVQRTLDRHDASGYFCLTPAVHDRSVVREIAALFDTVVECVNNAAEVDAEPSVSDCFEAISNARRRQALAALSDGEEQSVTELADSVAARTDADPERVHLSLLNVHLPKLADLGLVAYDREDERVAAGHHYEWVVPYLRKATSSDASRRIQRDR
jgi:DNA-binding transcriptional ArsR family regulator